MTDLIKKKPNVRNLVMASKTRLTYNCAHLRSTKENLTFEYLENIWFAWIRGIEKNMRLGSEMKLPV